MHFTHNLEIPMKSTFIKFTAAAALLGTSVAAYASANCCGDLACCLQTLACCFQ